MGTRKKLIMNLLFLLVGGFGADMFGDLFGGLFGMGGGGPFGGRGGFGGRRGRRRGEDTFHPLRLVQ